MLTEAHLLAALRDCYDPSLPCNIVDLGLVRSIRIQPDPEAPGSGIPGVPPRHRVHLQILLTTPGEPAESQLRSQILNRLAGIETISQTTLDILPDPWTPSEITPSGRRILGLDGNPTLVQIR